MFWASGEISHRRVQLTQTEMHLHRRTVLITFWHIPPWKNFQEEKIKKGEIKIFLRPADEENTQKLHRWRQKKTEEGAEEISGRNHCNLLYTTVACLDLFGYRYTYTDFPEEIEKEKSGKNCALIFAEDNVEKEEGIGSLLFLKKWRSTGKRMWRFCACVWIKEAIGFSQS